MSAQLPALKREKLLQGLSMNIDNLSMADVQSLLHWANNRHACWLTVMTAPLSRRRTAADPHVCLVFMRHLATSIAKSHGLHSCVGMDPRSIEVTNPFQGSPPQQQRDTSLGWGNA